MSPIQSTDTRKRGDRLRWRATHIFFTTVCLIAGCMFFFKLHEFLRTIKKDELAGFAFDPILTYGFVALGFFFLLVWAFMTGQFKDIERTKHEMIERVLEQERDEGLSIREETL